MGSFFSRICAAICSMILLPDTWYGSSEMTMTPRPVFLVDGARLEAAVAGVVDVEQLRARRDDLAARRQIRALHVLHERARHRVGLIQQVDAGLRNFTQVVRRNVGGHADRDALRAVEQHVRQARRQERGLLQRAVEVRLPVDGAVRELGQQHLGVTRELGLGVAHGRERLRIVGRAPVALPVDDRIAVAEILRHEHHGFVAGRVAVRMELADDVADGARAIFLCFWPAEGRARSSRR